MNDLHQLGCAELFPNNETAVGTWSGQSSFHGSTCDIGAASSNLFQYYLRPHRRAEGPARPKLYRLDLVLVCHCMNASSCT